MSDTLLHEAKVRRIVFLKKAIRDSEGVIRTLDGPLSDKQKEIKSQFEREVERDREVLKILEEI